MGKRIKAEESAISKHEKFLIRMKETFGDEYTVLGTFINTSTRLLIRHNLCDHEWTPFPNNLFSGQSKCPKCSKKTTFTTKTFAQKIREDSNYTARLVGEFKNAFTKVEIHYEKCGHSHSSRPNLVKPYCPDCSPESNSSKGEKKVREFLDENKMIYREQYSFDDCVYVTKLLFDFAIFDNDNHLTCLIEYDGVQHFKPVEWFGGYNAYISQVEKDKIKNQYCEDNNIKLIRIPYWEKDNIEIILEKELNKKIIPTNYLFDLKINKKQDKQDVINNTNNINKKDLSKYKKFNKEYLMCYYPEVYKVLYA